MSFKSLTFRILLFAICCNQLTAFTFTCNFFHTTHNPIGFVYICFLSRVDDAKNPKVSNVIGNHVDKKTNNDVKLFHNTKFKMETFPQGLDKFFPNLEGIFMYNSALKTISNSDFQPFPKLIYVMLQGSLIEQIPKDLFVYNQKVTYVNFNKNKLKAVDRGFLKTLPDLKFAGFDGNSCINVKADNEYQIRGLNTKLKKCYENSETTATTTIKPDAFSTSTAAPECVNTKPVIDGLKTKIKDLELKIAQQKQTIETFKGELAKKSVEASTATDNLKTCEQNYANFSKPQCAIDSTLICDVTQFSGINSCNAARLKVLDENQSVGNIKNKDQTDLQTDAINALVVLNQFVLHLPSDIDQAFPNLERLIVVNSFLTKVNSNALKNLKQLKVLNLASNQIGSVAKEDLKSLSKLEVLDLSGNQIARLNSGSFDGLSELRELKLHDNKITEIGGKLFVNNKKLSAIFLQGNQIDYVEENAIDSSKLLSVVDFTNNVCINVTYKPKSMRKRKQKLLGPCATKLCCRLETDPVDGLTCTAIDFKFLTKNTGMTKVSREDECKSDDSGIDDRVNPKNANDSLVLSIYEPTVHYLPNNLFQHFPDLVKLTVANAELRALSKASLEGFLFLAHVDFSNNEITELEFELFDDCAELVSINLSKNQIKELPSNLFYKLNFLTKLDLSHNRLVKLEAKLWPDASQLEEIYFNSNQLNEISWSSLPLKQLKTLDLKENDCIIKMCRK